MYLIYYSKANSANMQAVFPPGRKNSFVKLVIIQLHGSDSKEELLKDHRGKKKKYYWNKYSAAVYMGSTQEICIIWFQSNLPETLAAQSKIFKFIWLGSKFHWAEIDRFRIADTWRKMLASLLRNRSHYGNMPK